MWIGSSVEPYFGMMARRTPAAPLWIPRVVEVAEDVGLAHGRAEDRPRGARPLEPAASMPESAIAMRAAGSERHLRSRPMRLTSSAVR